MKKILIISSLILMLIFSGCASNTEISHKPLRIGVDYFPGWAHIFIAREKGFFEKNGVDVEIVANRDYLAIQEQFKNKELDGAFMVFADSIYANDQGHNVHVVYISDRSVTADVIAAKPEFVNIKDLRGKTVSVEGINSFSHLFLLSILEKNGMSEGDVFIKDVNALEVPTALDKGEIVAGHTYGHGKIEAKNKGYKFLAIAGDAPGIITDILAFNERIIKERPGDVKAVVKSLFEAKKFQETNREEALQILSKAIEDTPNSIADGIDAVDYLDLNENLYAMTETEQEKGEIFSLMESGKLISDFFLMRGQISIAPNLDEIIEKKFVKELLSEQAR